MKKYIALIILSMVAMLGYSQDVVRTTSLPVDGTYKEYNCSAADTLVDAGQDTIDFVFYNRNAFSYDKVAIGFTVDTVSAVDNGVVFLLDGANFENSTTWTNIIAQDTTADVAGVNQFYEAKQTSSSTDMSYRYYRVRLFMEASSGTGDKLKLDNVIFKGFQ